MDFALTQSQADIKAAARDYLADRYPAWRIAELADSGNQDEAAWPDLAAQGWFDAELGSVEQGLLAEESGRALHPTPWLATIGLALPVYHAAGVALPGPATVADGRHTVTVSDGVLDGRVDGVIDAVSAVEIIVVTTDGLFGVRPNARGVTLTVQAGVDPLRTLSDLELDGASARFLTVEPFDARRANALLACEAVGIADRALEFGVEHAKNRVQFDRPIGSYQAVAHQLADCYVDLELARSLAYRAVAVLSDEAVACAVHAGLRAATGACETAMQVLGGIGVTWEHPLHWWYRRALWLMAWHGDTLAEIMLL